MTRVLWLAVLVCVVQCLPMSQDELEDFSNFLLKTSSLDLHVKSADPDDSYDDDELVSDHAWEESGKFEGDLILNDRQRRLIVENVEGLSRNGLTDSTKRWPNNEVIYFIQREHFTSGQVQAIQDGIDDLARASCVKFRPYRKGDRDAVVIQGSRRGCFSQVGYQGGYQVLNLSGRHPVGRGCFRHGTVVHELLHSLGFYHMQSSPDRDDYIDVVWANIVQPARHNFRKYNSFSVSDFGVGYDYDSVLHYSRRAFSANGQDTLVPKKSGAEIGQRVGLSDKDTQKLNKMYCDADNDPAVQAEETTKKPKNKKKKPKNLPFEGHGIGYHQGKTVVIKLPAAEIYKLSNVPSTNVFDFSKTPQVVPPEAEGYRFGEEVTYPYKRTTLVNVDTIRDYDIQEKPIVNKSIEKLDFDDKTDPLKENKDEHLSPHHQNQVKPEYIPIDDYDKDLKDAFDRLNKIVRQHIYPQSKGHNYKINKDYSKFFVPLNPEHKETSKDYTSDNVDPPILYETTKVTPLKLMDITHTSDDKTAISQIQDRMDSSFRTSLPTKKPYHSFEQTETPNYATLDYLKDRHNFSDIYTPQYHDTRIAQNGEITSTYDQNYKDDIKINPHQRGFYTDDTKNIGINLKITPTYKNAYTEANSSKYEGNDNPKQLQIERDVDYTYRILLATKKPYSAYHHMDAPNYATLEYLKDRNDISNIYPPKKLEEENKTITYNVPKDNNPPTDGNWYTGDSYKNNPANYDQNSYSEYIQSKSKEDSNDSYEDNKKPSDSVDAIKNEPKKDTFYSKYSNEHEVATPDKTMTDDKSKESSQLEKSEYNEEDYDYYENDKEDENKGSYKENSNEYSTESPNHSKESLKYNSDYSSEAEEEQNTSAIKSSQEDEKSEESPKKTQAYTLYSVPVPLTKDWFKISYTIPETHKGDKHFT